MTAPTVAAAQVTTITTPATAHTVNLPASTQTGDRLLGFASTGRNNLSPGTTWGAGWTELSDTTNVTGAATTLSCAYLDVSGSPPSTVTVSTVNSTECCAVVYRITGYNTSQAPEVATAIDTSDPPNLSFSWGADDALIGAVLGADADYSPAGTYPYASNQQTTNGSHLQIAVCTTTTTGSSANPASWSSPEQGFNVVTFAVRGASSGSEIQATLSAAFGAAGTGTSTVDHPATLAADGAGSGASTATVDHPVSMDAAAGGSGTATAGVDHPTVLAGSFAGTGAATAVTDHPVAAAAVFGGQGAATATPDHPATLTAVFGGTGTATAVTGTAATATADLGGTAAATAIVDHPATATADLGFTATAAATPSTPGEVVMAADFGGIGSTTTVVEHTAQAAAAFGGTATLTTIVDHPAVLAAMFGGTGAVSMVSAGHGTQTTKAEPLVSASTRSSAVTQIRSRTG